MSLRRLRGDSDLEIQRAARWTSTKQLKTYDLTDQEDAFTIALVKRGLKEPSAGYEHLLPKTRPCFYCREPNKFTDVTCRNCGRPLDRRKIMEVEKEAELNALREFMNIPQIKELFTTVYALKKKVDKIDLK